MSKQESRGGEQKVSRPFQICDQISEHGPLFWTELGDRGTANVRRVAITDQTPRLNIVAYVLPEYAERVLGSLNGEAEAREPLPKEAAAREPVPGESARMTAEQFLCHEEHQLGMSRRTRWTWEAACQFAEAYAQSQSAEVQRLTTALRKCERYLSMCQCDGCNNMRSVANEALKEKSCKD